MAEIVAIYLADKDKTAIRAADLHGSWKNAKPFFGHLRPDQITRQVCRDYAAARAALGRKPGTIRKELECVRAAVNFNKQGDKAVFELPPPAKAKDRWLSKEEASLLVTAAKPFPHIEAFIVLSLATGARSSALLELTWQRVDLDRRVVDLLIGDSLDIKRKKRARVPLNDMAYEYLVELEKAKSCNHVIEWGGHKVLSVKKGFAAAVQRAGLKDVTPHTLRHTAASWMASARVPMYEISKVLGHSDTRVTERVYAHLHPDYLTGAVGALKF